MTMPPSCRLRAKIELLSGGLGRLAGDLFRREPLVPSYIEWLIATHQVIRATVPLIGIAHRRALELASSDPVAAQLVDHFEREMSQEQGHDDLLLSDLACLGFPAADVWARQPPTCVATLVGAQYYWVLHHHPVALLGYAAVAEGYPPTPAFIDDLSARSGLGPSAFRTLRLHAAADGVHRAQLDDLLDELPLTSEHESMIGAAAIFAAGASIELLLRLLAHQTARGCDK